MSRLRTGTIAATLAVAATVVAIPAASARTAMTAKYSGVVKSVTLTNHSFVVRTTKGKLVRIYTNAMTHYSGMAKSFMGVHKNAHLSVNASEHAGHRWFATKIVSM
jgi:hypothetical protein